MFYLIKSTCKHINYKLVYNEYLASPVRGCSKIYVYPSWQNCPFNIDATESVAKKN